MTIVIKRFIPHLLKAIISQTNPQIPTSRNPAATMASDSTQRFDIPDCENSLALGELIRSGVNPRHLIEHFNPSMTIADDAPDAVVWHLVASMLDPPRREKLPQYNTLNDAVDLIKRSSNIMVVSGAGISTSAGLPDFRSRDGIYKIIHAEHPDLDDPKQMFDIMFFRKNPLPFFQFAKALYPGQFKPTIGHQFIKCIEEHDKLLRNYTQNIDTLEMQAGIRKVVECHGSFAKATCTHCSHVVTSDDIRDDILAQRVPKCPHCCDDQGVSPGILKPNIVFFGEQLGPEFHARIDGDLKNVDLLIVIGSSMKVRPVALIPRHIEASVPQILINREPLDHMNFDIELLGNCDQIIQEICHRLGNGWTRLCGSNKSPLRELVGPSEITFNEDNEAHEVRSTREEKRENNAGASETEHIQIENSTSGVDNEDPENDDNWEDVEVIDDDSSSSSSYPSSDASSFRDNSTQSVRVPQSSYVFLKPNRYIFEGTEMTRYSYIKSIASHQRDATTGRGESN